MKNFLEVLEQCLAESGEILMRHYGKLERIEMKGDIDLVTIADRESEARIKQIIQGAFPDHQILAEESGEDYGGRSSDYRWIIDPLDGTTNYSHNFVLFSVSIALEHKGEIIAAGVEVPYIRERYLAEHGGGATLNGTRIHVSKNADLQKSLLVSGFPYDRRQRMDYYLGIWSDFMQQVHGILRLGSAAFDLCCVAAGRLDGFWEEKLSPWDTAAGVLLVQEAGGKVTDFAGAKFSPYGKQILATNGLVHDGCIGVLERHCGGKN